MDKKNGNQTTFVANYCATFASRPGYWVVDPDNPGTETSKTQGILKGVGDLNILFMAWNLAFYTRFSSFFPPHFNDPLNNEP
jgi:hypothetical protein